jgi:branched-chain amino acid transport system substrate-binding protein
MFISSHRRRLAITLVAALALVAAACGGDDDDDDADAGSGDITTTSVATPTGTPIVVFSSRNVEGGQSSFGPQSYGYVAGLQAQNKRGGIEGHPIQADFCDGHSNTNDEAACMQQGFDKGTVVAANTIYRSGDTAKQAFQSRGMTQINNIIVPATSDLGEADLATTIPGQPSTEAGPIMMKELKVATYIVPTSTRATSVPLTATQQAALTKAGVKQLDPVMVDVTVADMAPTAQALKEANADMVSIGGLGQANDIKLIQAMEAINYKPKFTGTLQTYTPADMQILAPFLNGRFFAPTGTLPADYTQHKEIQRFVTELEEGQRAGLPWLDKPYTSGGHLQGWVTAQAVLNILKSMDGDTYTPATFTTAAKAAKALDMGGVTAPWTPFEDVDTTTRGRQTYNNFYVGTVKDGTSTLLDSKLRCGKLDGCDN